MGKRRRRTQRTPHLTEPRRPPDHMARVRVDDDVWEEFRAAAGARPVAVVLGELVAREVEREGAKRIREGSADDAELLAALERAQELQGDLAVLVARLERRLDAGSKLGGGVSGAQPTKEEPDPL